MAVRDRSAARTNPVLRIVTVATYSAMRHPKNGLRIRQARTAFQSGRRHFHQRRFGVSTGVAAFTDSGGETVLAAAPASASVKINAKENQIPPSVHSMIFIPAPFSSRRGTVCLSQETMMLSILSFPGNRRLNLRPPAGKLSNSVRHAIVCLWRVFSQDCSVF